MKNFGIRLKKLRNDTNVTQDSLAEYLNISYQAVSKWENGQSLPDITLVPAIANFFGVSADYLLGIEIDKTNEDIDSALIKVNELNHAGKRLQSIEILEEKLKLYPNNHLLLAEWIECKCMSFDPKADKDKWLEDVIAKCNLILSDCSIDEIRYKTKTNMVFAYSFCDKRDIAEKLCYEFPENPYSKVEMMSMVAHPKERIKYKRPCIARELDSLMIDISFIAKYNYCFANPKDAIPVCKIALNVLDSVGCEGFLINHRADVYSDLANAYSKLKDKEQTLKYVGLAFNTYLELDELIESETYYYKSPLLIGDYFNKTKVTFGSEMNATEGFLWNLKQMKSYDWLKNDDDYIALYNEMKNKIVKREN